jgi:hypothetical protein
MVVHKKPGRALVYRSQCVYAQNARQKSNEQLAEMF